MISDNNRVLFIPKLLKFSIIWWDFLICIKSFNFIILCNLIIFDHFFHEVSKDVELFYLRFNSNFLFLNFSIFLIELLLDKLFLVSFGILVCVVVKIGYWSICIFLKLQWRFNFGKVTCTFLQHVQRCGFFVWSVWSILEFLDNDLNPFYSSQSFWGKISFHLLNWLSFAINVCSQFLVSVSEAMNKIF